MKKQPIFPQLGKIAAFVAGIACFRLAAPAAEPLVPLMVAGW